MNRWVVTLTTVGLLVLSLGAVAQESLTSYEPVVQLLEGFSAGDEMEGAAVENEDTDSPIVRQMQSVVNFGSGPVFVDTESGIYPSGVSADAEVALTDLSEFFGDTFNELPPLNPGVEADLAVLFADWEFYGESGLIDEPVILPEFPALIWAVELAEPFDTTCETPRWVGRTWVGESLTSVDNPLTSENLAQWFPGGTHDALVDGERTRLLQVGCDGPEPVVIALRVNENDMARPFGPTDVVAMVKDTTVAFLGPERIFGVGELQIDPALYANDGAGGPVSVFESSGPVPAPVTDVYSEFSEELTFEMDIPEDELEGAPGALNLLFTGETPTPVLIGTGGCPPPGTRYFAKEDFVRDILAGTFVEGQDGQVWNQSGARTNFWAAVSGFVRIEGTSPGGDEFKIDIDPNTGNVTTQVSGPEACDGTGVVLVNGEPIGDAEVGGGDEGSGEVESTEPPSDLEESGGVPWFWIAVALALVAGVTVAVGRTRSRKDCKPEQEAYDAATWAYERAREAQAHAQADRDRASAEVSRVNQATSHRLSEPDGEDPEELRLWQEKEAEADAAESIRPDVEAHLTEAEARLAEADAAVETAREAMSRARAALDACLGAAGALPGSTPPPPPSPTPPSDPEPSGECTEGESKLVDESKEIFTVPLGNVVIRSSMASWNRLFGGQAGIAQGTLAGLTKGQIEDALGDFDTATDKVRIHPEITFKRVTVVCKQWYVCRGGVWEATGNWETEEHSTDSQTETIGNRADSPSKETAVEHVEQAQARLKEMLASEAEYKAFTCP